jgi:predicted flap endonuclease-1-like 5' DNA nuclease
MIYLISELAIGLLLTALAAALGGWFWAAERAAPALRAQRRERENLLRDLIRTSAGETPVDAAANEREADSVRRLLEVRDARIHELEHLLEAARARADDALGRVAELERASAPVAEENEELGRLRSLAAQYEQERANEVEVEATPAADDEATVLQSWRLRYFEQRVRYLESLPHETAPLMPSAQPPIMEWRAREAEARASFLENELRARSITPVEAEAEAFASNSDVDALLRWRMLYLERRSAHLQCEVARAAAAPVVAVDQIETERWKWRARYLEARVRHLEQRPTIAQKPLQAAQIATQEEPAPAPAPAVMPPRRAKPPVLSGARNGAADDFTLIEGVSLLQQTTLYSLGVFHFDQIAAWTPENVAWVDQYLRLGGRIGEEEWVEQASDLAREGVAAVRRAHEAEEA